MSKKPVEHTEPSNVIDFSVSGVTNDIAAYSRTFSNTFEDAAAALRGSIALTAVILNSTVGDDAGNWSDRVIDGLQEAQRLLLEGAQEKLEVMRLEYLAVSSKAVAA